MEENYGVAATDITTENISSTVSSEMRTDAVVAVVIATICMLLYIWFRFKDIRFATSAVVALVHDVLVVLAFYVIARVSVGNTFIACMLTIVGYSINATIVIFDRIREELKTKSREQSLKDLVNHCIMQTLTRSIYTNLTTFIMVVVLYILGVSSIKEFARSSDGRYRMRYIYFHLHYWRTLVCHEDEAGRTGKRDRSIGGEADRNGRTARGNAGSREGRGCADSSSRHFQAEEKEEKKKTVILSDGQ